MSYLLDTCVVSELTRPSPQPTVARWLMSQPEHSLFLSVLTLGEIQKGIGHLAAGEKRSELEKWLRDDLRERFGSRILPVSDAVALTWGLVQSALEARGTPMAAVDGLLSATARTYGLVLATRNVDDFRDPEVKLHNPWLTGAS